MDALSAGAGSLFPNKLEVRWGRFRYLDEKAGNGGWGDLRDRFLCLAMSEPVRGEEAGWTEQVLRAARAALSSKQ